MIEGHGNNIYNFGDIEADFSSNVAFNNNADRILDHLRENISALENYPDPMAVVLTRKIAQYHDVEVGNVVVANGSAEAFYTIAHFLSRRGLTRTAITTPSFAEYEDSCRLFDHELRYIPLNELLSSDLSNIDTLWLGAPNNPDGERIYFEDIERLAEQNPAVVFVVDRAYNDLAQDAEDEVIVSVKSNIIITNSFTKSYGIPGLRLGYIIAPKEIVEELTQMRPPWSVNALALIAGEYILDNRDILAPNVEELITESLYLQDEISQIEGYRVTRSRCNFFLVEICDSGKNRDAVKLCDYLVNEHKILIRNASNFRGLTPRYFRVAALDRAKNEKLIKALKQWISI